MKLNRITISGDKLALVAPAESFCDPREPSLFIGNFVRLNSGGPTMLIVDVSGETVTVARQSNGLVHEAEFPSACLHRIVP